MAQKSAFDWTRFTLKVRIKATPQKVFAAWTYGPTLASWFPEKAEVEPKKGGRFFLQFLHENDQLDAEITAITKNRRLVFPFGSKGEEVEVKVRKQGTRTICELTQYNMKTGPTDKVQMHMGCRAGWTFFLTNLKAYLEHGVDLREHDRMYSDRQGFVNS